MTTTQDLVALLRESQALGLRFDIGTAYIRRDYITHQTDLNNRIKAALDGIGAPMESADALKAARWLERNTSSFAHALATLYFASDSTNRTRLLFAFADVFADALDTYRDENDDTSALKGER